MYEVDNEVATLPLDPDEYQVDPIQSGLRVRVEETMETEAFARSAVAKAMLESQDYGMPGIASHLAHAMSYCDDCYVEMWTPITVQAVCDRCRLDRAAKRAQQRQHMETALSDEVVQH